MNESEPNPNEGRVEDIAKAQTMAEAENPARILTTNAKKLGLSEDFIKEHQEEASRAGEAAGEKYERIKGINQKEIGLITKEILHAIEEVKGSKKIAIIGEFQEYESNDGKAVGKESFKTVVRDLLEVDTAVDKPKDCIPTGERSENYPAVFDTAIPWVLVYCEQYYTNNKDMAANRHIIVSAPEEKENPILSHKAATTLSHAVHRYRRKSSDTELYTE